MVGVVLEREREMEGGRKVLASPRGPWSGVRRRRVLANKRPRTDGFVNSVKKLQRREISSKRDRSFSMTNAQERFRNMRLTVCLFLHLLCFPPEKPSRRRCAILERQLDQHIIEVNY